MSDSDGKSISSVNDKRRSAPPTITVIEAVPTSARLESSNNVPVSASFPSDYNEQGDLGGLSQQQPNNPWISITGSSPTNNSSNGAISYRHSMVVEKSQQKASRMIKQRASAIQSTINSSPLSTASSTLPGQPEDIANESTVAEGDRPALAKASSSDTNVINTAPTPGLLTLPPQITAAFQQSVNGVSAAQSTLSKRRNISKKSAKEAPSPPKFTRLLETSGRCQNIWAATARIMTCCFPNRFLERVLQKTDPGVQQAWREKVGLCLVSFLSCVFLGYFTFYYQSTSCPPFAGTNFKPSEFGGAVGLVRVNGLVYDMAKLLNDPGHVALSADAKQSYTSVQGMPDLSGFFKGDRPACSGIFGGSEQPALNDCSVDGYPELPVQCHETKNLVSSVLKRALVGRVYYEWKDIIDNQSMSVYNGKVLDLRPYDARDKEGVQNPELDALINRIRGKDASLIISQSSQEALGKCLTELYNVGDLEIDSIMCIAANTILTIVLVMILGLIIVRFVLAIAFDWFLSWQLGKIEANKSLFAKRKSIVNVLNVNDRLVTAATHPQSFSLFERVNFKHQYKDLYTMCLVTCYSEDEAGLRTTLDSLAMTDYNSEHKMIFIVADGVVKGAGNPKPTGEIILDMIDLDPGFHGPVEWVEDGKGGKVILCANAQPQSYVAIGQGSKRHNMAKTYCGTYTCQNRSVAVILVYKCGTPAEASAAKPGNRGKRDSQILLMDFLSKTMFDEPSSPFQFDLFCKWTHIMTLQNGGRKRVTPDLFEIVLMVDADTKVLPDALTKMVAVMQRDPTVMGLCGETRIMNKNESWVTMIQVFEYYISHHLAKAFESIFGGVTCLPGCFCMYRIKSPKPIDPNLRDQVRVPEKECSWVPIITNPDILADYSASEVDTLHKKNLLLLGEDRYLSTLMLRKFPKRKMMFVPKALCRTTVPAKFSVLLSQRRRWINSTIHNLMELVLVSELCGTFCFSMQFVVFLELVGTITLPAAICFTMVLIGSAIKGPEVPWVPLGLLFAILGLPAVLIFITSFNYLYIGYLFVYLLALPIWNFVLPTYAFWHFDDFSWGITRPVAGEKKGADSHGHGSGDSASEDPLASIPMKRWAEYENSRKRILAERGLPDPIGFIPGGNDVQIGGEVQPQTVEKTSALRSDKKRRLQLLATRSKTGALDTSSTIAESTSIEPAPTSASLTPRPIGRGNDI